MPTLKTQHRLERDGAVASRRGVVRLKDARGAQLLEMALALPLLLVLTVGILDFGTAYNLRQIMNNAAREGARLAASQDGADLTQAQPASVQAICNDVLAYLQQANVDTSFILNSNATTCPAPNAAGAFAWSYYSSGTYGLLIEREVPVPDPNQIGGVILSTRITLTYPYNWLYGFNRIIRYANPGTSAPGTLAISTYALMANIPK